MSRHWNDVTDLAIGILQEPEESTHFALQWDSSILKSLTNETPMTPAVAIKAATVFLAQRYGCNGVKLEVFMSLLTRTYERGYRHALVSTVSALEDQLQTIERRAEGRPDHHDKKISVP